MECSKAREGERTKQAEEQVKSEAVQILSTKV